VIVQYDPDIELKHALAIYFEKNAFGADGGYNDAWVDFKLGPIPFPFPNTKSRVRAVRYHDLHHIVTGYDTNVVGEFEISAWEIGAGCKDFAAAWVLNLGGTVAGVVRSPLRTFRAFVRGRRSRSFYGMPYDEIERLSVTEARRLTGTDAATPSASLADGILFTGSVVLGLVIGTPLLALMVVALPFGLLANLARPVDPRGAGKKAGA
jgi:hypothetical protein